MIQYSNRVDHSPALNRISQAIASRIAPYLDLTASNPTQVLPHYPHPEIVNAFSRTSDLTYAPEALGARSAREAIARYYQDRGIAAQPERMLLTASTSEAYTFLFALLCNPGDEVLSPHPSYPLFEHLAALCSIRIVPYRLNYDGAWHIDFPHLRSRVTPATRAIITVNPNNPTGHYLHVEERRQLLATAAEHSLPVISDEVFAGYSLTPASSAPKSLLACEPPVLTFSLNGLSKAAAMPQLKLAWIALNGPDHDSISALQRLELIADTYLSVGTPVQQALPELLSLGNHLQSQIRHRTRANLQLLRDLTAGTVLQPLHAEAGWSAILQIPATRSEEEWVLGLLNHANLLVQPGYFFDMPREAFLVLSLLTPELEFAEGLRALKTYVATQS